MKSKGDDGAIRDIISLYPFRPHQPFALLDPA
jgi:hypothetical protein